MGVGGTGHPLPRKKSPAPPQTQYLGDPQAPASLEEALHIPAAVGGAQLGLGGVYKEGWVKGGILERGGVFFGGGVTHGSR